MVSIRRQRLIKLYGRSPSLEDVSSYENGQSPGSWWQNTSSVGMQHLSSVNQPNEEITKSEEGDSSIVSESNTSNTQSVPLPEFKRRKRHRRKNIENQEQCIMRGVYYKNMKWQAAIKVDKKQIHLGTVGSQEEAARLYDRAAYLCGREPNFDLTVEEKEELSKLSWDDFLIMTRSAINSKKSQRRISSRMKFENFHPSNSGSEVEMVAVAEVQAEADQGRNHFSGSDGAYISAVAEADQGRIGFSAFDGADISAVAVAEVQAEAYQGRNGFSAFDGADISAVAEVQAEADQGRNGFPGSDGADISAA